VYPDAHSLDMTGTHRQRRAPLFCNATVKSDPSVDNTHACTRHVCFDIRWIPTHTTAYARSKVQERHTGSLYFLSYIVQLAIVQNVT